VILRDFSQAVAASAILQHAATVDIDVGGTTNANSFQLSSAHPGSDSFDDQVAFQFSNGGEDNHNGPSQRAAGIELYLAGNELQVQVMELIEQFQEVLRRTG